MNDAQAIYEKEVFYSIRSREPLAPRYVKLSKMIQAADLPPGYVDMCANRIFDADLCDFESDDIQIDFVEGGGLLFTSAGMEKAKDILRSYLSEETYKDFLEYIRARETIANTANDVTKVLREASLSMIFKAYPEEKSAKSREFYRAEIRERLPFTAAVRRIKSAWNNMRIRRYADRIVKDIGGAAE